MTTYKRLLVLVSALLFCISASAAHTNKTGKEKNGKHHAAIAKVNINTADSKTLQTVKGIGPKRAAAIINYREKNGPFKSIDDLNKVKGKGYSFSKRFVKRIAKKITV